MQEFSFCVTRFFREPSKTAYQRAARRIRKMDANVSLTGCGYPAVTDCKYQAWCVAEDYGNASTIYRGEEAKKFQKIIDEELGKYKNLSTSIIRRSVNDK